MPEWLIPIAAVAGFSVVFPAFWCGVVWLVGATGWRRLAARYPADAPPVHRVASQTSARIRWTNYNGVLHVGVSREGLHLSVMALFRVGHPPMRIPWSAITNVRRHREWFRDVCTLRIGEPATTVTLPAHVLDAAGDAVAAMRADAESDADESATAARTATRS